ncbi:protein RETICULATA-RELATED 4, chloroplastic-like [Miscanthus floridulus]|uniref:protein RETICULATA-RELATED 4, chloroplastic-like n=1 Tax=Miscanthus floridulus TaxID=154761 RepID=UPI00345AC7CF
MASPRPTSLSSPAALIHLRLQPLPSIPPLHPTTLPFLRSLPLHLPSLRLNGPHFPPLPLASSGSGSGITGTGGEADLPPLPLASSGSGSGITGTGGEDGLPPSGGGGGGGGGDGDGDGDGSDDASVNRREALFVLAQLGRKLESLPADLAAAVEGGRIPGEIVRRFVDLEASPVFRWLLQFGGFKERLLADDLFLTKVAIECGVGIFTKTAAEYEKRRENFVKELDFVIADVVMAIVADFMLVWLPAPTVPLQPPLAVNSGGIAKFFYNCPDNAFQVALSGTSYSLLQRVGAILRNGAKLFAVGTSASLVGTGVTNALIKARQAASKDFDGEVENLPILSTSVAYGVYMAVSSNLRYQVLAGVIEQRMLEPLLHQRKLILSAASFAVRTGNTFLGSLLWIDYARWVGVQ